MGYKDGSLAVDSRGALIILSTYHPMKFPREWQNISRVLLDGVANRAEKCFARARNLSVKSADGDMLSTTE